MRKLIAFDPSSRSAGYGMFLFRFLISVRLIYGVQDNILSWKQMIEFEHFLAERGVPFPLLGAITSVYVQFICGILYLLGAASRLTGVLLVVNFIAALLIAHRGDTFVGMFQALTMLFAGLLILLDGPGKFSVDARRLRDSS
ncbi:MAG TPA: DoxX family protein [Acidobacteriota bacterium]|nr:DoxX family protein [Acidobacteriota bacterium]